MSATSSAKKDTRANVRELTPAEERELARFCEKTGWVVEPMRLVAR